VLVRYCESGGGGNRNSDLTDFKSNTSETETAQIPTNPSHITTLQEEVSCGEKQKSTLLEHQKDAFAHEKCATCVQQQSPALPDDLAEIVMAEANIPEAVKAGILAMVRAIL